MGLSYTVARAQDEAVFEPPKASYGLLNIVRVDELGFYPDGETDLVKLYADPKTIGDNSTEARKSEIEWIKTSGAPALRLGAALAIKLKDLTWLKFFDDGLCVGWDSCQRFTFVKYDPDRGYVTVGVFYSGGSKHIFVWLKNGRCMISPGVPIWSPSGSRYFSYGAIDAGAVVAQIVEMSPDGPSSGRWLDDLSMMDCVNPEWADDKTIHMSCLNRTYVVELVEGTWRHRPR